MMCFLSDVFYLFYKIRSGIKFHKNNLRIEKEKY